MYGAYPNIGGYTQAFLLEKVKMQQWHKRDGKELNDLEILAHLQHQGAATPLMDWSRSFAVALWFACDENEGKDGIIVMMNILANLDKKITAITSEYKDGAYDKLERNKIYYWEPASTLERIISQSSVFLFSKTEPLVLDILEVLIPHSKKKKLREEILLLFGIDKASLYDDFVGFVARNKPDDEITLDEIIEVTTKTISSARGGNNKDLLASSYNTRALAWVKNNKLDKALADYNKAIELDPNNAEAYISRGIAWVSTHRLNNALADFSKAIELDPKNVAAYTGRGAVRQGKRELDKALADYNKAIELDPNNALAYMSRSAMWRDRGEFDKAIVDSNKALELDSENVGIYINRALMRASKGELEKALEDYNKSIELDPNNTLVYIGRGSMWRDRGEFEKALTDCNKAVELAPNYAEAYNNRGLVWHGKHEFDKAIADFNKAIELDSENAIAYANRCVARGRKGEYDEARIDANKAIELATKQGNDELLEGAKKLKALVEEDKKRSA